MLNERRSGEAALIQKINLRSLKLQARFIDFADVINSRMPEYVVSRVADALNVTHHQSLDWQRMLGEAALIIDTRDALRGIEGGRSNVSLM